jgi:hypothetical protein
MQTQKCCLFVWRSSSVGWTFVITKNACCPLFCFIPTKRHWGWTTWAQFSVRLGGFWAKWVVWPNCMWIGSACQWVDFTIENGLFCILVPFGIVSLAFNALFFNVLLGLCSLQFSCSKLTVGPKSPKVICISRASNFIRLEPKIEIYSSPMD